MSKFLALLLFGNIAKAANFLSLAALPGSWQPWNFGIGADRKWVCETYDDALLGSPACLVMPMRALISILPACSLALGLFSVTHAFGEGWCVIIEIPKNQQAVAGDPKPSVGKATSSVHPRAKAKAQRRTPQALTSSTLDDTQLKAFILSQSAAADCDGARIVEGDESGHRIK